jgi:hypothetical protein
MTDEDGHGRAVGWAAAELEDRVAMGERCRVARRIHLGDLEQRLATRLQPEGHLSDSREVLVARPPTGPTPD